MFGTFHYCEDNVLPELLSCTLAAYLWGRAFQLAGCHPSFFLLQLDREVGEKPWCWETETESYIAA